MLKSIYIFLLGGMILSIAGCSQKLNMVEINATSTLDGSYTICTESTYNTEKENHITGRSNNITCAYDLITNIYPEEILLKYHESDMFKHTVMSDLNDECEIECIRKINDNKYYTIHISDTGGILYSLFSKDDNGVFKIGDNNTDTVLNTWYVSKNITKSCFETLKINFSTVKDVKNIDMYGFYPIDLAPYRGRVLDYEESYHLTADGYKINVIYNLERNNEYVIKNVIIEKADENSLYGQLLKMDRPEYLLNRSLDVHK